MLCETTLSIRLVFVEGANMVSIQPDLNQKNSSLIENSTQNSESMI